MNALNIARQQYNRGEITVEEMQTAEREAVSRVGENARQHVEAIMAGGLPALRGAGPATRPGWTEIEGGDELDAAREAHYAHYESIGSMLAAGRP